MRVFVTGATGHIGSAVVRELLEADHHVVGLARSDRSAAVLKAAGAEARRGSLGDLEGLRTAAAASEGVIHLAFNHEAMRSGDFLGAVEADRKAVEAIGSAIEGSGRPVVSTSGTMNLALGGISGGAATEDDVLAAGPRIDAENYVVALAQRRVRSSVVRLPPVVHGTLDNTGFVPTLIRIAREVGVAGYVGDGGNRWPAVHTNDAARVYRLALEGAEPGSRFHAVAEEGIPLRELAEAIGSSLKLPSASIAPEDTAAHFGHISSFVSVDNPTSSLLTRERLAWSPVNVGLIAHLADGHYFRPAPTGGSE